MAKGRDAVRTAADTFKHPRKDAAPRSAGREFLTGALAERSATALIAGFTRAVASEGMTRHRCTQDEGGAVRLLACDYAFEPEAAIELGQMHFQIAGGQGERLEVVLGGRAGNSDPARRARLHGLSTLYAITLPALLVASEDERVAGLLTAKESETLARLLLGQSELDISLATDTPVRAVTVRAERAATKLGAESVRRAIVLAAQRGFLNRVEIPTGPAPR